MDEEGAELPSIVEAEAEAVEDARMLMSEAILNGRDISAGRIDILDQNQVVLTTVHFKDTFRPDEG